VTKIIYWKEKKSVKKRSCLKDSFNYAYYILFRVHGNFIKYWCIMSTRGSSMYYRL